MTPIKNGRLRVVLAEEDDAKANSVQVPVEWWRLQTRLIDDQVSLLNDAGYQYGWWIKLNRRQNICLLSAHPKMIYEGELIFIRPVFKGINSNLYRPAEVKYYEVVWEPEKCGPKVKSTANAE